MKGPHGSKFDISDTAYSRAMTIAVVILLLCAGAIGMDRYIKSTRPEPFNPPVGVSLAKPSEVRKTVLKAHVVDICGVEYATSITNALLLAEIATDFDPMLLLVLMATESECNPRNKSPLGYVGLMQTPWATKEFYDVDTLYGARILQQKLFVAKGDWLKALAYYKGGDSPLAYKQAKEVLTRYEKEKNWQQYKLQGGQ